MLLHVRADARGRVFVEEIDGNPADALLAQRGGQRAQAILTSRDEYERGARLAGETASRRFADPAGSSCDQPNHLRHPISPHRRSQYGGVSWTR